MLQIKLLNVKASLVKFVGGRDTKLPFQVLQGTSANRSQGDHAFQTPSHAGQLDAKTLAYVGNSSPPAITKWSSLQAAARTSSWEQLVQN